MKTSAESASASSFKALFQSRMKGKTSDHETRTEEKRDQVNTTLQKKHHQDKQYIKQHTENEEDKNWRGYHHSSTFQQAREYINEAYCASSSSSDSESYDKSPEAYGQKKIVLAAPNGHIVTGMEDFEKSQRGRKSRHRRGAISEPNGVVSPIERFEQYPLGKKCLINPNGQFKKIWETLNMAFLVFVFVYLPVRLTFLVSSSPGTFFFVLEVAADLFFMTDTVLNFFIPIEHNWDMVYEHKEIAKVYLKGWFWIDLISSIPFDFFMTLAVGSGNPESSNLLVYSKITKTIRILRLLKILRAFRMRKASDNYITQFMSYLFGGTIILMLLKGLMKLAISVHLLSCFWFIIGNIQNSRNDWMTLSGYADEPLFDKYIICVYFIMQTFTTTGYGDITSERNLEKCFRIFLMIAGVYFYSSFTGEILEDRNRHMLKAEILHEKTTLLDKLKRLYQLSQDQIEQIQSQLKKDFDKDKKSEDDSSRINLESLSDPERDRLFFNIFCAEFEDINLFKHKAETNFVLNLGSAMELKKYEKGEPIYLRNEPAASFYIIKKGEVSLKVKSVLNVDFLRIKEGFFGEYEILKSIRREYSAHAATNCILYKVKIDKFKKIFMQNSDTQFVEYFEKRAETRHQAMEYSHDGLVSLLCLRLQSKYKDIHSLFGLKARKDEFIRTKSRRRNYSSILGIGGSMSPLKCSALRNRRIESLDYDLEPSTFQKLGKVQEKFIGMFPEVNLSPEAKSDDYEEKEIGAFKSQKIQSRTSSGENELIKKLDNNHEPNNQKSQSSLKKVNEKASPAFSSGQTISGKRLSPGTSSPSKLSRLSKDMTVSIPISVSVRKRKTSTDKQKDLESTPDSKKANLGKNQVPTVHPRKKFPRPPSPQKQSKKDKSPSASPSEARLPSPEISPHGFTEKKSYKFALTGLKLDRIASQGEIESPDSAQANQSQSKSQSQLVTPAQGSSSPNHNQSSNNNPEEMANSGRTVRKSRNKANKD